eukprot:gene12150-biopygen9893
MGFPAASEKIDRFGMESLRFETESTRFEMESPPVSENVVPRAAFGAKMGIEGKSLQVHRMSLRFEMDSPRFESRQQKNDSEERYGGFGRQRKPEPGSGNNRSGSKEGRNVVPGRQRTIEPIRKDRSGSKWNRYGSKEERNGGSGRRGKSNRFVVQSLRGRRSKPEVRIVPRGRTNDGVPPCLKFLAALQATSPFVHASA